MACSAGREGRNGGERGISGLLTVIAREVIRGWLVTRLGIWLIGPFLLMGVGWWLDSLLLTGFKAAVFVALAVAWFVDFEFGRSKQREYAANLGCGRLTTIGLTVSAALFVEIAFYWAVTAL